MSTPIGEEEKEAERKRKERSEHVCVFPSAGIKYIRSRELYLQYYIHIALDFFSQVLLDEGGDDDVGAFALPY